MTAAAKRRRIDSPDGQLDDLVIWHDVECGAYRADLPLWRELAAAAGGPVLDVGAGTGRVALDLARRGAAVTALDREPVLLATLAARAAALGLHVETVVADARSFALGRAFGLAIVPMQTAQLLDDLAALLQTLRAHLVPGGLAAIAIATDLEPFEADLRLLPAPDRAERSGWRYFSQPLAIRARPGAMRIERLRIAVAPDGRRTETADAITLATLDVAGVEAAGRAAGLRPEPARSIDPTREHVGSEVVMLRG